MNHPVSFLRCVGLVEAASFLVLLFIAMPLKYVWGMPQAVRVFGSVHGGLFVLFCFALWRVLNRTDWSLRRAAFVFAASLLPFGSFLMDRRMRSWAVENRERQA